MMKKHKFKLASICKNSWIFVLRMAMKNNYLQENYRCAGSRGKKLRKLGIYRNEQ